MSALFTDRWVFPTSGCLPSLLGGRPLAGLRGHALAALAVAALAVASPAALSAPKAAPKAAPMAKVAASASPAALRPVESCSWDKPGSDALVSMIPPTVEHFADIPRQTRQRLKARMNRRAFDDFVTIRRDSISGKYRYAAQINQMQFGNGTICKNVKRNGWAPTQFTRALVYCEDNICVMVPTELRNVALVKRLAETRMAEAAPADEPDLLEGLPPTGAGPAAAAAGTQAAAATAFGANEATAPTFEQVTAPSSVMAGLLPSSPGAPVFGSTGSGGDGGTGGGIGDGGTGGSGTGGGGTGGGGSGGGTTLPPVTAIPEPGMLALWGAGLATLGAMRRRRKEG